MMIPDSAIAPSIATKPKGMRNTSSPSVTPISPSGAVSTTISVREKLFSWIISSVSTAISSSGMPATIDLWPRAESSTAPPTSMR